MKKAPSLWVWILFTAAIAVPREAAAISLDPDGTSALVSISKVIYDSTIRGRYASVVMELDLRGEASTQDSGEIILSLPPGAVLHKAEIFIYGEEERWEAGETLGRREGHIIYEDVTTPTYYICPLLVQRIGPDLYRARVYPVISSRESKVRFHYAHLIDFTGGKGILRFSLGGNTGLAAATTDRMVASVTIDPEQWDSADWNTGNIPYCSTSVDVSDGSALFECYESFRLDTDVSLELGSSVAIPVAGALQYAAAGGRSRIHAWWDPDWSGFSSIKAVPRSVVFVLDRSGSMCDGRLTEARKAVEACLRLLTEEDHFGIVAFDHEAVRFASEMRSGASVLAAVDWLRRVEARGGTDIAKAVRDAAELCATSPVEGASIDLLLITDGETDLGAGGEGGLLGRIAELEVQYGNKIRVFGCGVGLASIRDFVSGLASATGAEATFALTDGSIADLATALFAHIRSGGVSHVNVKATGTGFEEEVYTWPLIFPDEVISVGVKGEAEEIELVLSGTAPDGEEVTLGQIVAVEGGEDEFVYIAAPLAGKVWADGLEREIDTEGETYERAEAAVVLAKTYGIVTRYSSILALETDDLYGEYGIELMDRDPAGIALSDVEGQVLIEIRGPASDGDGMPNADEFPGLGGGSASSGCSYADLSGVPGWEPPPVVVMWMLLGFASWAVVRCRRGRTGNNPPG